MTSLEAAAIFVGVPLGIFLLIAVAVSVPSWIRYRPGMPWDAEPVWFNGPDETSVQARPAGPVGGAGGSW